MSSTNNYGSYGGYNTQQPQQQQQQPPPQQQQFIGQQKQILLPKWKDERLWLGSYMLPFTGMYCFVALIWCLYKDHWQYIAWFGPSIAASVVFFCTSIYMIVIGAIEKWRQTITTYETDEMILIPHKTMFHAIVMIGSLLLTFFIEIFSFVLFFILFIMECRDTSSSGLYPKEADWMLIAFAIVILFLLVPLMPLSYYALKRQFKSMKERSRYHNFNGSQQQQQPQQKVGVDLDIETGH